jgi:hypothetical protein
MKLKEVQLGQLFRFTDPTITNHGLRYLRLVSVDSRVPIPKFAIVLIDQYDHPHHPAKPGEVYDGTDYRDCEVTPA